MRRRDLPPETRAFPPETRPSSAAQPSPAPPIPVAEPRPAGAARITRRRLIGLVVGLLVLASLFGLLAWRLLSGPTNVGPARINPRPAPAFALTGFDGQPVRLADLRGRPVIVNFWASWCNPCRLEARTLEDTWQRYRERGAVLVGIAVQDNDADSRAFLREFGITYPNAPDPGGKTSIDYGMTGVPETYFIRPDGQIVAKFQGPLTAERLDAYIADLLR